MDAKITKSRLSGLLSYDWFKIIAIILGGILFWSLVFTTTATRITDAQEFTVFNHYANQAFPSYFTNFYSDSIENGVYSHEVLDLTTNDLKTAGDEYSTILQTRLATNQGDVMFVPGIGDENYATTDADGNKTYPYTYVESFMFSGFGYTIYDLDKYFEQYETLLNNYYSDYTKGETLNKEKVEADFRARIKENKDKRYKKEAQIEAGIQGEYERMEKYRVAYVQFQNYLTDGIVSLTHVTTTNDETGEVVYDGNYAINLCPNEGTMGSLKKYAYYLTEGETGVKDLVTAKNMHVMFFNFTECKEGYQFENLLFVNTIIADCLAAQ